ncbi:MAG TPA: 5'-nucleotidase, lipoprotein e(P4) family [Cyclobacteriaceae bacterium]|jgi:5'-nucleotidase (lipoprotein e(P4) family)|nr:5'-nucleotidase, lipoprotein e(P4) family [Cyclobacteriaceae bacterium]
MRKIFTLSVFVLVTYVSFGQTVPQVYVKEYAVLWQQDAAEYRALCYQAFNLATLRINEIPAKKLKKSKLAIITDLDETIIDNSYNEAQLMKDGKFYTAATWKAWADKSMATALPGAVEFLQAAKQKGITIFYVSNRSTDDLNSTLINLKKLNLPDAKLENMLFLSTTSSKEERRQTVMKDYEVIMLMGDNLNDFMSTFEKKPSDERFAETDKVKEEWGKKFIVLPNPSYGEWENALYQYKRDLTPEQRETMRREKLKGY